MAPKDKDLGGSHKVIIHKGVVYKFNPYAAGVEYAVNSLNHVIACHQGSPSSRLFKCIDAQGRHYSILAMQKVVGTELQFILQPSLRTYSC